MNWNDASDEQLRTAAAEWVLGWSLTRDGWNRGPRCDTEGRNPWLRDWNRDDLAQVFAASDRGEQHKDRQFMNRHWGAWSKARDNPRAALAALLGLLKVPLPKGTK